MLELKYRKQNYATWLFVVVMFAFPIILKVVQYFFEHGFQIPESPFFSIVLVIQSSLSFYATAFSFTFAVYSFNKQQEKIERDRLEREQELEEARSKEFALENQIRLKELESKKDFYRPTFLVDQEGVRLLMRDSYLFLENIQYFPINEIGTGLKELLGVKKSGEIIKREYAKQFYILAETIVGEKILFGYLNGQIKVYKYLIEGQNPLYPRGHFDLEKANSIWGSYNSSDNYDILIEKIFYLNSEGARESFVFSNLEAIKKILDYNTLESYYNGVFREILNENELGTYTQRSLVKLCEGILTFVRGNHLSKVYIIDDRVNYDYLRGTVERRLSCYISDYDNIFDKPEELTLFNIVNHVLEYIERCEENDWILGELLRILSEIFENIKFMEEEKNEQNQLNFLISMTFNTLEFTSNN